MKKIFLLSMLLFSFAIVHSQTILNVKLKKYTSQTKVSNDTSANKTKSGGICEDINNMRIKFISQTDGSNEYFSVLIVDSADIPLQSFVITQLNKDLFYSKLKTSFNALCDTDSAVDSLIESFKKGATDLYTQYLEAKDGLSNTSYLAGVLTINKHVREYKIQKVQIQFQDGFIENIKVYARKDSSKHLFKFENTVPASFSTTKDFIKMFVWTLWEKSGNDSFENASIRLGDLISYNQNLDLYNKDYSPANQVLNVDNITSDTKEIPLYKEQTSKLFQLKVFTDLKGVDNTNPNGLIQFEVDKKINLFTRRYPFMCSKMMNYGWLNYFTPKFTLSKIEQNQRNLIINHIDSLSAEKDSSKAITYASTLNLLKYQVFNVGADLALFTVDMKHIKSVFNFGVSASFGRTIIQDTLRVRKDFSSSYLFSAAPSNNVREYGVNTFQWGPYLHWQILPDPRYSFSFLQRFTWFKSLSDNFIQTRDDNHFATYINSTAKSNLISNQYSYGDRSISNKCIATTEIYAAAITNKAIDSKIFGSDTQCMLLK